MYKYKECKPIVEELYKSGTPVSEIVRNCGTGYKTVYKAIHELIRENKIPGLRRRHRGTRKPLSPIETETILEMWRNGVPAREIARKTNRPLSTVYYVLRKHGQTTQAHADNPPTHQTREKTREDQ